MAESNCHLLLNIYTHLRAPNNGIPSPHVEAVCSNGKLNKLGKRDRHTNVQELIYLKKWEKVEDIIHINTLEVCVRITKVSYLISMYTSYTRVGRWLRMFSREENLKETEKVEAQVVV